MQAINYKAIKIGNIRIANNLPMALIGGPCVAESRAHVLEMAGAIKEITDKLNIPFIFKSSFDKANRTSINSSRGVGFYEGIEIFREVKEKYGILTITDIHESTHAKPISEVVDVIQIPALLCKQTDLLVAAAKTGLAIKIKKGQFVAPEDVQYMIEKVTSAGNENVMICERGSCFGYHKLINDMAGLRIMAKFGYPIIFDGTHSVQEPAGRGACSGGNREFIPYLCRAALSVGVAALYLEIHDNPEIAPCDGPNMVRLSDLESFLIQMKEFDALGKKYTY